MLDDLPPLVRAAAAGDLREVRILLDSGSQPTEADDDGWTAVHAAAVRSHPRIVETLLAAGADPNAVDADGFTPLLNAAGPGDSESVRALIAAGAEIDATDPVFGWTPLGRAAEWDNLDVLALLLQSGADPNRDSPLIAAAEAGSLRCVQALVAAGADHSARVGDRTAEEYARSHGHAGVAAYLDELSATKPEP